MKTIATNSRAIGAALAAVLSATALQAAASSPFASFGDAWAAPTQLPAAVNTEVDWVRRAPVRRPPWTIAEALSERASTAEVWRKYFG